MSHALFDVPVLFYPPLNSLYLISLTHTRMSCLPYDIINEIVDIIRQDADTLDSKVLYTMSLTCRSILQLCRKHLFYEMTLEPRKMDDVSHTTSFMQFRLESLKRNPAVFRIKTVERLVESSPDILKNVRRLFLESHQSNYNDTALIALLSKFDNLVSLSITARDSFDDDTSDFFQSNHSWNSLSKTYQFALVQLIHRSPLTDLAFDNYGDIPSDIFLPFGNLLILSLSRTTFSSNNLILPSMSILTRPTRPLQLKELWVKYYISDIAPLLDQESAYGQSIIDPAALKSLTIELRTVESVTWDRNMLKDISNLDNLFITNPRPYSCLLLLKITSLYLFILKPLAIRII